MNYVYQTIHFSLQQNHVPNTNKRMSSLGFLFRNEFYEIQNKFQLNLIRKFHLIQWLNQLIIFDLLQIRHILLNSNQKMICLLMYLIGMIFFIQIKMMIIKGKDLKTKK